MVDLAALDGSGIGVLFWIVWCADENKNGTHDSAVNFEACHDLRSAYGPLGAKKARWIN